MSLIILLALSLLATSSMQNSVMQERMSNASREGLITLEAAEAALREVEDSLEGLTNLNDFGTASGWYQTGDAPAVLSKDTWDSDGVLTANAIDGLEPKYFIEYLGRVSVLPGSMSGDRTVRNLNFEGSGDSSGGGGAAGPGDAEISIEAESMRIVVMATGPSEQSRRIIESYYFISANNIES